MVILTKLINSLLRSIEGLIPAKNRLPLRCAYLRLTGNLDPELLLMKKLGQSSGCFLDVGANIGVYSYSLLDQFSHVHLFEPLSEITFLARELLNDKISIRNVALSNTEGDLDFFIPILEGKLKYTRASLEPPSHQYLIRRVPVRTIDSFEFENVEVIKIDVEGHELQVLKGAEVTLQSSRPILICEIEQRHSPVDISKTFDFLASQNYLGYFLGDENLVDVSEFTPARHQILDSEQRHKGRYINNFIFLPSEKAQKLRNLLKN